MIEPFTDKEELSLETKVHNNKPSVKSNIILSVLFFGIIFLSILAAGFFGKNFLSFFIFYMFFGFPLMVIYKDQLISMIPKNIASYIVNDIQSINVDIQESSREEIKVLEPIKNKEYFTLFIGISCFILSQYILIKHRTELNGIFTSLFFCITSNIIIGDLF
tara:strand:+ start:1608 stop:2093 length:486 start_codon:yes stop_codon:yes gene_type:complete